MTVADTDMIRVQNLANYTVGYYTFDGHRRSFMGQQTLQIPAEELRQLIYSVGGQRLVLNYLSVKNKELALELGVDEDSFDNEYNWTNQDVINVVKRGSLEELADALDFAPSGIVDSIVDFAVSTELNDYAKRKLIAEMTGKDIDAMIKNHEQGQQLKEAEPQKPRQRRVQATGSEAEEAPAPKRRRTTTKKTTTADTTQEETAAE